MTITMNTRGAGRRGPMSGIARMALTAPKTSTVHAMNSKVIALDLRARCIASCRSVLRVDAVSCMLNPGEAMHNGLEPESARFVNGRVDIDDTR